MARFRSLGHWQAETESGLRSGETFTCAHCGALVDLKFGEAPAMCHAEWLPVCPRCHAKGTCTPFEKKLDRFERIVRKAEARGIAIRSFGLD